MDFSNNKTNNNMTIANILIYTYLDYVNNYDNDIVKFADEYEISEQVADIYIKTGRELYGLKENENDK